MSDKPLLTSDYNYFLPPELIAQHPPAVRGTSRLMVVDRAGGKLCDRHFNDLPDILDDNSFLVINSSRVIPARMPAKRATGGKSEVFFLTDAGEGRFTALVKGKLRPGETLYLKNGQARAVEKFPDGSWLLEADRPVRKLMHASGELPLPPYIKREVSGADADRYQTVYAREDGSVAAPTAGLHFTEPLLEKLKQRGTAVEEIVLHVGIGTFRPVKTERLEAHEMHYESYFISEETAERINALKRAGKKLVAVGTTVVRTLESAADEKGVIKAGAGRTNLFIRPGYTFRAVDRLITNFHLPQSTLMVLVSALTGHRLLMESYAHAVTERYRFFSYGDAMFIL